MFIGNSFDGLKMVIVPNLVYRFNILSVKLPENFSRN